MRGDESDTVDDDDNAQLQQAPSRTGAAVVKKKKKKKTSPVHMGFSPPLSGYNKQEAPVTGPPNNRNHQLQLEPVTVQPYQPRAA
ncbi:unnamed protein product [Sphagnum balticum]